MQHCCTPSAQTSERLQEWIFGFDVCRRSFFVFPTPTPDIFRMNVKLKGLLEKQFRRIGKHST
jgi:hypothetical protein